MFISYVLHVYGGAARSSLVGPAVPLAAQCASERAAAPRDGRRIPWFELGTRQWRRAGGYRNPRAFRLHLSVLGPTRRGCLAPAPAPGRGFADADRAGPVRVGGSPPAPT